jgi:hypothetical protein
MKEIPPRFKKERLSPFEKASDFAVTQFSHWKNGKQFSELRTRDYVYSLKGFDELECIFVHIPKAAGVSVNRELFGNLGGAHRTVRTYKRVFGPVRFKKYFKFTFVRNPYSRLLSAYRFLKRGGFCDVDKEWAEENLGQFHSFPEFVHEWLTPESIMTYNHFRPQFMYLCDRSFEPEVDFIGRFESIDEDFEKVCQHLNISRKLKKYNRDSEKEEHWTEFYTDRELEKVYQIYKKDFELFNYSAEP